MGERVSRFSAIRPDLSFRTLLTGAIGALLAVGCAGPVAKSLNKRSLIRVERGAPETQAAPEQTIREARGAWLDRQVLAEGHTALAERLDRLRDSGFNTVHVAVYFGDSVLYSGSKLLPQWKTAKQKDPELLEWLLPQIQQRGLKAEAWAQYGVVAYAGPDASAGERGPFLAKNPELAAVNAKGESLAHDSGLGASHQLCPVNPKSRDFLVRAWLEVMTRYPQFDGLNADRVRFASEDHCRCGHCKLRFKTDTGLELADFASGSDEEEIRKAWRKKQLRSLIEELRQKLRDARPTAKLSVTVSAPAEQPASAQDWPEWLGSKLIDAATVNLLTVADDFASQIRQLAAISPKGSLVFPVLSAEGEIAPLGLRIGQVRELGFAGLSIGPAPSLDSAKLLALGQGEFAERRDSPLYSAD